MQDPDLPARRIVEDDVAHPHLGDELERARRTEERLILPNGFALVVEDRPARADPARGDVRAAFGQRSRLGLSFSLDLTAEAVGVGEGMLVARDLTGS